MMDALSCWVVDWDAIAALTTSAAVVVALWVGLEPRRLEHKRQARRAAVSAGYLLHELRGIRNTAKQLMDESECNKLIAGVAFRNWTLKTLEGQQLSVCIATGENYPEQAAHWMGGVFATLSGLRMAIELLPLQSEIEGQDMRAHIARIQRFAESTVKASLVLEGTLMMYLPEDKRSVSNTPASTSKSMS